MVYRYIMNMHQIEDKTTITSIYRENSANVTVTLIRDSILTCCIPIPWI